MCQIGGIPGNTYVPGTLIRPQWNGIVTPPLWGFLLLISTLAGVALRDRRIFPSKMVVHLYKLLEYAPATAWQEHWVKNRKDGKVQACTNPTFGVRFVVRSILLNVNLSLESGVDGAIRCIKSRARANI